MGEPVSYVAAAAASATSASVPSASPPRRRPQSSHASKSALAPEERVKREARRSQFSPVRNKVQCLACGRYFVSYTALEAHLLAKHDGVNSPDAKQPFKSSAGEGNDKQKAKPQKKPGSRDQMTLTDFMRAAKGRRPAAAAKSGGGRSSNGKATTAPPNLLGREKHQASSKRVVVNTNMASGDQFVVRRSKERVTGKKQKVTRVKMEVLLSRSGGMVKSAEEARERARARLEAKRLDLERRASASGDDDLPTGAMAAPAPAGAWRDPLVREIEALEEELADCEAKLGEARDKYQAIVRGEAAEASGGGDEKAGEDEAPKSTAHCPVRCEVCNIECPNLAAFEDHCKGKLHRSKEFAHLKSVVGPSNQQPARQGAGGPCLGPIEGPLLDLILASAGAGEEDGPGESPRFQRAITPDLNACVAQLLERLLFLQRRAYNENPTKNKSRKRVVFGLNEVRKSLKGRTKVVIMVPNLELGAAEIARTTGDILKTCFDRDVKVVFALTRSKLGSLVKRGVRMTMCSVLDYSGAEDLYKKVVELHSLAAAEEVEEEEEEGLVREMGEGGARVQVLSAAAPAFVPRRPEGA